MIEYTNPETVKAARSALREMKRLRISLYAARRLCFVLAVLLLLALIVIANTYRPLNAGLSDTQIPSKVHAGAVMFTVPPAVSAVAAPAPLDLHAFAVHVISLEGHAPDAHEIADAMFAEGVPLLTPYMSEQEAALLLLAMMRQESHFRLDCIGDGGAAIGLMQWHYTYYAKYSGAKSRAEWTKAECNIRAGATVLSHRFAANSDFWLAVQRYNSPNARKVGKYANSVKRHHGHYRLLLKAWTKEAQPANTEPTMDRL